MNLPFTDPDWFNKTGSSKIIMQKNPSKEKTLH